jgi:hypothetical protein
MHFGAHETCPPATVSTFNPEEVSPMGALTVFLKLLILLLILPYNGFTIVKQCPEVSIELLNCLVESYLIPLRTSTGLPNGSTQVTELSAAVATMAEVNITPSVN